MVPLRAENPCVTLGEEPRVEQYGQDAGRAPDQIWGRACWTHASSLAWGQGLDSAFIVPLGRLIARAPKLPKTAWKVRGEGRGCGANPAAPLEISLQRAAGERPRAS